MNVPTAENIADISVLLFKINHKVEEKHLFLKILDLISKHTIT